MAKYELHVPSMNFKMPISREDAQYMLDVWGGKYKIDQCDFTFPLRSPNKHACIVQVEESIGDLYNDFVPGS